MLSCELVARKCCEFITHCISETFEIIPGPIVYYELRETKAQ